MAFEQPLEADKVGDNSLIAFISSPVIGTLSWILGARGDDSNRKIMNEDDQAHLLRDLEDMDLSDDSDNGTSTGHAARHISGNGGLPRLVRSEVSVGEHGQNVSTISRVNAKIELNNSSSNSRIGEKKKMSWSENLVEYMDEVSCVGQDNTV